MKGHPGGRHHQHQHAAHGVMSGRIVRPYDLVVGGLLMRGAYRGIARAITAGLANGAAVLDVGTGPGRLPAAVHRQRPDLMITGVDPSADMLERAGVRSGPSVRFLEASAEALPLSDHSQQVVVSSLSSHHWADIDTAVAEQARVLVSGGRWWAFDLRSHVDPDLDQAIERAGLQPVPADVDLGLLAARFFTVFAAIRR